MNTLDYYNENAVNFIESTREVKFAKNQNKFIDRLKFQGRILDFGCGSGRDIKYFLDNGLEVEATDGSEKMCELASRYSGIQVRHLLFEHLDAIEEYDGIWACASILHCKMDDLIKVIRKMQVALKENGIIYMSFKYGEFEGLRNDRYFTDMTLENFKKLILEKFIELEIEEHWITGDVREGRGDKKWLNLILRKK